jgi:hypothetical protein
VCWGSAAPVTIAIDPALHFGKPCARLSCRSLGSDVKKRANYTVRHPDISGTRHPVGDRDDDIADPIPIVEMVSPSRGSRAQENSTTSRHLQSDKYAITGQDMPGIDLYTSADGPAKSSTELPS